MDNIKVEKGKITYQIETEWSEDKPTRDGGYQAVTNDRKYMDFIEVWHGRIINCNDEADFDNYCLFAGPFPLLPIPPYNYAD